MIIWTFGLLLGGNTLLIMAGLLTQVRARKMHQNNQQKALSWSERENRWSPLLDAFANDRNSLQTVWKQVEPGQDLYFVDYLMRLSISQPENRPKYKALAEPYLPKLAARLANHSGDAEQRSRAVQTISLLGRDQDIPLLARSLDDESPMVKLLAALSLSQHRQGEYAEQILAQLDHLADWHMGLLINLLSRMGADIGFQVLTTMEKSQSNNVQTMCLHVLTNLKFAEALNPAVRLLSSSEDVNVQVACLSLLGKMGTEEHLPLIRSCYDSPLFAVRLAVIRALHQRESSADSHMFQRAFDDSSRWVALQAAQALKSTGNEHVLHEMSFMQHPRAPLAKQVLNSYEDLKELEKAVQNIEFKNRIGMLFQKLEGYDNREMQRMVTRLFFHPLTHPEVRYAMATQLSRFKNYQFFYQTLSSFILGSNDQRSLIRALHSFANPEAVPALIEYYRGKSTHLEKLEIIDSLGEIDSIESLEFLSKIYNDLFMINTHPQYTAEQEELQQKLAMALARKMAI